MSPKTNLGAGIPRFCMKCRCTSFWYGLWDWFLHDLGRSGVGLGEAAWGLAAWGVAAFHFPLRNQHVQNAARRARVPARARHFGNVDFLS